MCGRFNVTQTPGLNQLLAQLGVELAPGTARFNLAPTEDIPLLHDGRLESACWWLTPSWAPDVSRRYSMFNARCETLASSRAFRHPFHSQRGIVPMSSFIEWRVEGDHKQPWLISNDQEALAVAALWDVWHGGDAPLLSCTLVTTAAADEFLPWHARMPVLLDEAECRRWLDSSQPVASDDPLFRPVLKFPLNLYPIDRVAGNARRKDAALMAPVGAMVRLEPKKTAAPEAPPSE